MPALPPNSTDRWFVDYTVAGHQHTMIFRAAAGTSQSTIATIINDFLTSLGDNVAASGLDAFRFQVAGSDFSIPAVTTGLPATWGTGGGGEQVAASYLSCVGRGGDGRRARITVFGFAHLTSATNFRAVAAEIPQVSASVGVLNAASPPLVNVGGAAPTWYNYWDCGQNAYWRNKLR